MKAHPIRAMLAVMRIGIFGATGPAGSALGARLASIGYHVVLGSRSRERAVGVVDEIRQQWAELELPLDAGTNDDAAAAELIVIATPWDSAATTAAAHAPELAGKVVVSMANALVRIGAEFQPLIPPRGSVAAHVQAELPRSSVVAAYHHLPAKELGHLGHPVESDVLICGDDPAAVDTVVELTDKIEGCRALATGGLSNAAAIEAFTAVLLQLNVRYKTRVAPRLTGLRA
jgi:NADPH-dependent F420 reductase